MWSLGVPRRLHAGNPAPDAWSPGPGPGFPQVTRRPLIFLHLGGVTGGPAAGPGWSNRDQLGPAGTTRARLDSVNTGPGAAPNPNPVSCRLLTTSSGSGSTPAGRPSPGSTPDGAPVLVLLRVVRLSNCPFNKSFHPVVEGMFNKRALWLPWRWLTGGLSGQHLTVALPLLHANANNASKHLTHISFCL